MFLDDLFVEALHEGQSSPLAEDLFCSHRGMVANASAAVAMPR